MSRTARASLDPIGTVYTHDTALVPEESGWGQGYATRTGYTPGELGEIAANMTADDQLGYRAPRLFATTPGWHRIDTTRCVVPSGHDAELSPNRSYTDPRDLDADIPTNSTTARQVPTRLQRRWRERGWVLDQHGRPCHPWHDQLLADPRIGLNTGIGYGHFWGEATIVDVVALDRQGRFLTVAQHTDPNHHITLALPGGYTTPADQGRTPARWQGGDRPTTRAGIYTTARRRLAAETGQTVPEDAVWRIVRAVRPVSWPHTTLHFWVAVYTVAVWLPTRVALTPRPGSGATAQHLADLEQLRTRLWPDHYRALTATLAATLAGPDPR